MPPRRGCQAARVVDRRAGRSDRQGRAALTGLGAGIAHFVPAGVNWARCFGIPPPPPRAVRACLLLAGLLQLTLPSAAAWADALLDGVAAAVHIESRLTDDCS